MIRAKSAGNGPQAPFLCKANASFCKRPVSFVPVVFPGDLAFVAGRNVIARTARKALIAAEFDGIALHNAQTFQIKQLDRNSP